jgi:hypothetical protein
MRPKGYVVLFEDGRAHDTLFANRIAAQEWVRINGVRAGLVAPVFVLDDVVGMVRDALGDDWTSASSGAQEGGVC